MAAATPTAEGTTSRRAIDLDRFGVSEIAFPPDRRLPWHAHPRGCVAVVVEGAVLKRFARAEGVADDGTVVTMPPEEPHEDVFGREGARIVVVEIDEVGSVRSFRDWTATHLALRIAGELRDPDPLTPLAVEGLALELAVVAQRGPAPKAAAPWLETVRELLHERFREPPTAHELATEVGVHPSHLARAFRAQYGDSLGGYARRLRLDWTAERLVRSDEPLAALALEAGFVDQSHLTRAFRRRFGLTPARYRRAHR
jgi:AraC-like DNA-binding protein/quercetin dioxygenase-like cupin family protein